jgi:hypothetical protein
VTDTKVADWAWKPTGTGPPAGPGTIVDVTGTEDTEEPAVVEVVASEELVVGSPAPVTR